jgi:tellurite resistance protein
VSAVPVLLILILILMPMAVIAFLPGSGGRFWFARLINHFKFSRSSGRFKRSVSHKAKPCQSTGSSEQPDLSALNCRARPTKQGTEACLFDTIVVEICGSIYTPGDSYYGVVEISLADVTDQTSEAMPVHSSTKQWQGRGSEVFCYNGDIGRLPKGVARLPDWTAVAQLSIDWLEFPRKGKRQLQLSASILSRDGGEELACAQSDFIYENPKFGYLDMQENIQQTKSLAVALAFAMGVANGKLLDCEIELIKNWARGNIDDSQISKRTRRKFEKALDKTVAFFRGGNQVDVNEICREIAEIAPLAERYDILEVCLHVAGANGSVGAEEMTVLKKLASQLEIDTDRFRDMMGKILPADMHSVEDAEVLVGVTSDMDKEQARHCLNKEYRKWNARATNSDPQVQNQADYMLKFIAQARSQYIE